MKIYPSTSEQNLLDDAVIHEKTKERIEVIKNTLNQQLAISTKKIELLDEIRRRKGKRATSEERRNLEAADGPYSLSPATSDMIALMLDAKAEKRHQKNIRYEPFLINSHDILVKWALYNNIAELVSGKEPFRYDFIIKTDVHCSPMQIDFDGEYLRFFYIDARGDLRNFDYATSFQETNQKAGFYSFSTGGIQFDHSSCAIFSLQHLNNLSNCSLEDRLTLATKPGKFEHPLILAPIFLKNIQSTSKLEKYYKKHANKTIDKQGKKTLKQHIDDYSITVDISSAGDGSITKTQNHALAYKNHKYLQAALNKLNTMSFIEAERAIEARCDVSGKNTVGTALGSHNKANVVQSAVDSNNQMRIKELIKYAIEKDKPEYILELIKLGVRLNAQVGPVLWKGRYIYTTPIAWAISIGHIEIINKLLDLTPDKSQDCRGIPYLHNTISEYYLLPNPVEIVTLLVQQGADLRKKDQSGNTIVEACIASHSINNLSILNALIKLGAKIDVNAVNLAGETLLLRARSHRIIEFLIQLGSDIHFKNSQGQTLLDLVHDKSWLYRTDEMQDIINLLTPAGLDLPPFTIKEKFSSMKGRIAQLKEDNHDSPKNTEGRCCNIM